MERLLSRATPASGAVVMGTGIVSVALASDDRHILSLVLLVIAAVVWVGLALGMVIRVLANRPGVLRDARSPAALMSVAGTAVLGARATGLGWSGVAVALLVIAAVLWLSLLPGVLRGLPVSAAGVAFMPTVSTQSLAVVAAQLAVRVHAAWLLYVALGLLALGLALYVLVLARFRLHQLLIGRGDQWVSGGALAISTLAAARITLGAHDLHVMAAAAGALQALTLALWCASAVWLVALLITETIRPRLGYHVQRWATVFPVGMYAACSFDAGRAVGARGLTEFARVWVWVAVAVWLVVFVAALWPTLIAARPGAPADAVTRR